LIFCFEMAGYSLEMSSQVSTSYKHASPTVTSSHLIQQAHNFRASQSVDQQCAREVLLKKNQQILVMYDHAMVCKDACGLPFCEKVKKALEHAVQCDSVQCTRSCMFTKKVIKHLKACYDHGCALCEPLKELVSRRSAQIDNEHSMRHDLSADEPEPKRFKPDQPNGILGGINAGLEKLVDANVVSGGQSVKELRDKSYKDLGCSVNEATKEPQIKSVKKYHSLVDNSVTMKPSVKSAMDEMLTKEVRVETDKHMVVDELDNEDGIERVKDSDPLNNTSKNITMFELAENVDSGTIETMEETTKRRIKGASLLDTFTLEEINIHLSGLRIREKKVNWVLHNT
jgi:TAZ zinc finger